MGAWTAAGYQGRFPPHELAHGAFNLRHTFSGESKYQLGEGATDNLMDYGKPQGTKLWKYQWDLIHDPENVLFAWTEKEEEGEMKKEVG